MKQEFVTLPREVVEQAIDALYCTNSKEGSPAYNFELKAIKELRAALEQPQECYDQREPLTDKQIDAIAESMPGGLDGFLKGWGWRQFARAVLEAAPQPPTVKECLTDELKPRFSAHDDAERLKSVARGMSYNDHGESVWKHTLMEIAVRLESGGYAAPQPPVVEQHTDDAAVNRFAEAMKAKLAVARDKGRGGWDDPAQCTVEYLAKLLVDHIAKGDPIDVANFAMMLHQRQADKSVLSEAAPTPTAVDHPEPAYLLRDLADDISVDALDLIAAIRDAGLGNYSINMKLPTRVCVAMCQKFSDAQQPQVEQEPVAVVDFTTEGWRKIVDALRTLPDGAQLYTRPQPRREPLENGQARRIYDSATYAASLAVFMTRMDAEHPDADDKGVSGWLQEAEDRVKRRITEAAHEIVQAAAPQQGESSRANTHPTVKPTELMRYLCRLVTPPGGTVLDPFMGSGSTGKAARLEGFRFVGCELSAEYLEIARARIEAAAKASNA